MSVSQAPIFVIIVPFLAGLLCGFSSLSKRNLAMPIALLGTLGAFVAAVCTLTLVPGAHESIHYRLGGWNPPLGIEFVVDYFNAMVLIMITFVCLVNVLFSAETIAAFPMPRRIQFYTLTLLLQTGLSGMVITGDLFNVYVFLEITALTSYALIAFGGGRAYIATLNYLLMGSIGACFFLLGVGYLYIKTGTLNMAELHEILPSLYGSPAVTIGVVLCILGMWIKMGFFPVHAWLPNAYTYAPEYVSPLMAPLATKVSVYVMIRLIFSVFDPEFVVSPAWGQVIVIAAAVGIAIASLFALAQRDLKKMLTYIVVAEVGYMVGGVWLGNSDGIVGSAFHILADGLMTLCLFLAVAAIVSRVGSYHFDDLNGIFRKMPITMAAFVVGAVSMIGVPPTGGFFSKWYLIQGGIAASNYWYVAALLFSSLVNAVLFFRIFEIGFFGDLENASEAHGHGHGHGHGEEEVVAIEEAPLTMLIPLVVSAISVIAIGLMSSAIVTRLFQAGLVF